MTKSKALICSIIGPSGKSGDILAEAVDRVSGVLSPEGDLPFDFQWERDIFYEMGKKYGEQHIMCGLNSPIFRLCAAGAGRNKNGLRQSSTNGCRWM